jgi:transcriptional regulator with XRE-family HTH domain
MRFKNIAELVRYYRIKRGFSNQALLAAAAFGYDLKKKPLAAQAKIKKIENNERQLKEVEIKQLSSALNVPEKYFYELKTDDEKKPNRTQEQEDLLKDFASEEFEDIFQLYENWKDLTPAKKEMFGGTIKLLNMQIITNSSNYKKMTEEIKKVIKVKSSNKKKKAKNKI